MTFREELKQYDKDASEIREEGVKKTEELLDRIFDENMDKWAVKIIARVKKTILKQAKEGDFRKKKGKKIIAGHIFCNYHEIAVTDEERALIEQYCPKGIFSKYDYEDVGFYFADGAPTLIVRFLECHKAGVIHRRYTGFSGKLFAKLTSDAREDGIEIGMLQKYDSEDKGYLSVSYRIVY